MTSPGCLDFMLGDRHDGWLAARLDELDSGYIHGVCRQPSANTRSNGVKTKASWTRPSATS